MRLVPTGRLPDALSSIRPQSFDRNFPAEEVLFHPLESSRVIPELATFPSKPTFQSLSDQTTRSFGVFQVFQSGCVCLTSKSLVGQTPLGAGDRPPHGLDQQWPRQMVTSAWARRSNYAVNEEVRVPRSQ